MKNKYLAISIIAISIVFSLFSSAPNAAALPGGAVFGKGYFHGLTISDETGVDPILTECGGATPFNSSMATNKTAFINRIIAYYTGGCSAGRNSLGARFIMLTMLNRPASAARSSGDDLVTDWRNYINGSDLGIKWMVNQSFNYNSGCYSNSGCSSGASTRDEYYRNANRTGDSLVFYKISNSAVLYSLKYDCGNPVGYDNIEIVQNWSIIPTVSIVGGITTANPGTTITWVHKVQNTGPDATTKIVYYNYKNISGLPASSVPNGTLAIGSGDGASSSFNSTYLVTEADRGKNLCRSTYAAPSSKDSNVQVESDPACVYIPRATIVNNACRPILYTTNSSPLVSVHTGNIPTYVYARNNSTGATTTTQGPFYYGSPRTLNFTVDCTTGDTWTIYEYSSSYVYYHYNYTYSCGTALAPATCTGHRDLSTSYRKNTNIGPCYDYVLTSRINNFWAKLEPGASVIVNPSVSNASFTGNAHSKSKPTKWQITKLIVQPNSPLPADKPTTNSSVNPCTYFFPGSGAACSSEKDNNSTVFNKTGNPMGGINTSLNYTVPDYPAGTKICFAFSLFPSQSDPLNTSSSWGASDVWNHAAFSNSSNCVIVVKKPKAQIWGGDLWSKGSINTSTSVKNNYTFGSWVEYGVFATDSISGTASGSAFAGSTGLLGNNPICKYSPLTFTSAGSSSCSASTAKGFYNTPHVLPDVEASFPGTTGPDLGSGPIAVNSLSDPNGLSVRKRNGDLTLGTNTLSPGKSVVLKVSGTVTIVGNQTYNANNNGAKYTSTSQLPQLIIIANKIIIGRDVTNVDAWLVARGSDGLIQTCDDTSTPTINTCKNSLTVNGPIIAKSLRLMRTAGSGVGVDSNDPAEIFNLRADAYLWASAHIINFGRAQTVYTVELPPRY